MRKVLDLVSSATLAMFASAPALAHYAVPCFDQEVSIIENDIQNLEDSVDQLIDRLKTGDLRTLQATMVWLGFVNSDQALELAEKMQSMSFALDLSRFLCIPYEYEDYDANGDLIVAQAFVVDGDPIIYLTTEYFEAEAGGPGGRPSILFHELMHLNLMFGANFFPDTEEVYTYEEAKELAEEDSTAAQNNAQNYTYFFEQALFGAME